MTAFTLFLKLKRFLFQDVCCGFELHNFLCSNLDSLTRSGVTALSGRALGYGESAEANEGDFAVLLQFSFSDIHDGIDSLSCINLGHASLFGYGAD